VNIIINSTAEIAKGFTQRREKKPDDNEAIIGHLKFSCCFVPRETIDELCGMDIGWSQSSMFDEHGDPLVWCDLSLFRFTAELTGTIAGIKPSDKLTISNARISNVVLTLTKQGALMAGEIAWEIAGDESSDLVPLQGNECRVHIALQDSGQQDMVEQQRRGKAA